MRLEYWKETADGGVAPTTWEEIMANSTKHLTTRVALDEEGQVRVSTVFLCIDHGWYGDKPVLYETMVFGHDEDGEIQERYHTRAEALEGHAEMCRKYLGREPKDPNHDSGM